MKLSLFLLASSLILLLDGCRHKNETRPKIIFSNGPIPKSDTFDNLTEMMFYGDPLKDTSYDTFKSIAFVKDYYKYVIQYEDTVYAYQKKDSGWVINNAEKAIRLMAAQLNMMLHKPSPVLISYGDTTRLDPYDTVRITPCKQDDKPTYNHIPIIMDTGQFRKLDSMGWRILLGEPTPLLPDTIPLKITAADTAFNYKISGYQTLK